MTRLRLFLGVLLVMAWPVSPATLNFMVVETGFGQEGVPFTGNFESSVLWETCLFDVFFEAGHVVSNSPILPLAGLSAADFPGNQSPAKEFPGQLWPELENAILGGADYLVFALLSYPRGAADLRAKPEGVSLRIYAVNPAGGLAGCRFVYEGAALLETLEQAGNRSRNSARGDAEAEGAKRLIRGLVPYIRD
jgi:hypothetical protein